MPPQRTIWLTGMPRSGTNWVSQILASSPEVRLKLCPLFSYEFKDALDETASTGDWQRFFRKVYETSGEYLDQVYLRKEGLVPEFAEREAEPPVLAIKSTRYHHLTEPLLERDPEIRFIALVRHPAGAIHSWLDNPHEFPAGADPMEQWRSGTVRKTARSEYWGFDDWLQVTQMHLRLAEAWPDRFLLLRYETFVAEAEATARRMFDFAGLGWHGQSESFLRRSQESRVDHSRSVYKPPSTASRWRQSLDPQIAAAILKEIKGTPIQSFLED
ncbi:hypothetical protein ABI59_18950 [Acidobacteria bacterium Mor1]|nr:hypothetical protein ABI59_18950 [Acidobacteria bacterium Mor1]